MTNSTTDTTWGWTAGAGVERAVAPKWTIKAEYAYMDFGGGNVEYPRSIFATPAPATVPGGTTSVSDQAHVFKIGVNRQLGSGATLGSELSAISLTDFAPSCTNGLDVDFGARYWYSDGKFVWGNKSANGSPTSRQTYSGLTGSSGELFARVDTPINFFIKGNVGLGAFDGGKMVDEDWGIPGRPLPPGPVVDGGGGIGAQSGQPTTNVSYSNTVSDEKKGQLNYGSVDIGYDLTRGPGYKAGPFIGFSHYTQKSDSFGCAQVANSAFPCVDAAGLAVDSNHLIGNQKTAWDALRIGASTEFSLGHGFKIIGDAAYLTAVTFSGQDFHGLRALPTWFDQNGYGGAGVQFEGILSYDVTNHLSVGVGGRYWAMWTGGRFTCTGSCDLLTINQSYPDQTSMERYGVLLQASYKLGGETYVPLK